jgi:MRG-binding protein
MHKHFRMIAIRDYMLDQGVINLSDEHTSTAGIWRKLELLYDLPRLDEREDSVVSDGGDDDGKSLQYWKDFELPRGDFEAMTWDRRLAPDGGSSPGCSRRESTVADTDEPRSSPVSARGASRGGRARKSGRLSRLQNELETERSSRRTSKTGSVADEDHPMDDVEDEEGHGSGEDEEDEDEEQDDDEKTKSSRGGVGRGRGRGRGRRGRRRG